MNRLAVGLLRFFIAAALLGALFGQAVIIPVQAQDQAEKLPELASMATPYAVLGIAAVACLQAALLALWMLLGMVEVDAIFTVRAFRWVDVVLWAAVAATALTLGTAVHLWTLELDEPAVSLFFWAVAAALVELVFVLLAIVMRGLLRKAVAIERELAQVV